MNYTDDSEVIDIIEAAKEEWFATSPCITPTDEDTDESINRALGLNPSGSLRGLAVDLADMSEADIRANVREGLDRWYGAVDTSVVEHYDSLPLNARREYRENTSIGDAHDNDCISRATAEQLDAIDEGCKPPMSGMSRKLRACSRCNVLFEPAPSQLAKGSYVCRKCRKLHYESKYAQAKSDLNKAVLLITELENALAVADKKPFPCSVCGKKMKASKTALQRQGAICSTCRAQCKADALKLFGSRRKTRIDRRSLLVAGPLKPCRVCKKMFQPTPSQYTNYNYICKPCRFADRKTKGHP